VPLLAWWPGSIPAGKTTHAFITALEIFPTLAAAGGAKLPAGVNYDGFDLLPVLQGKIPSPRREMFWDFPDAYQAARMDNWKWVSFTPRGRRGEVPDREELFDLAADPGEKNDLAAAEPQRLAELKVRFARWRAEMAASEPRGPFRDY
jgi:arylsulfatase A-like enzyme